MDFTPWKYYLLIYFMKNWNTFIKIPLFKEL
jgi:hypothetical protein